MSRRIRFEHFLTITIMQVLDIAEIAIITPAEPTFGCQLNGCQRRKSY
jgi:hypothetical protein